MQNFLGMAAAASGVQDVGNMAVEQLAQIRATRAATSVQEGQSTIKKFPFRAVRKEKNFTG